jgi:hypothetical protein
MPRFNLIQQGRNGYLRWLPDFLSVVRLVNFHKNSRPDREFATFAMNCYQSSLKEAAYFSWESAAERRHCSLARV